MEGDSPEGIILEGLLISIHSLRVEGDMTDHTIAVKTMDFNPLPPCGGRLPAVQYDAPRESISIHSLRVEGDYLREKYSLGVGISIHSLRVEGDADRAVHRGTAPHFNPLPPCGGRRICIFWHGICFA